MTTLLGVAFVATNSRAETLSLLRGIQVADSASRTFWMVALSIIAMTTDIPFLYMSFIFAISLLWQRLWVKIAWIAIRWDTSCRWLLITSTVVFLSSSTNEWLCISLDRWIISYNIIKFLKLVLLFHDSLLSWIVKNIEKSLGIIRG